LSPIISEFTMAVSSSCPETHRVEGNEIEIYTTGTTYPQFIGEIIKSDFIKDSETYNLLIRDNLYKLKEKLITKDNLEALIQAGIGIEYWASEQLVIHTSVQAIFLIEQMFSDCGLSFNYAANYKDRPVTTIDGNAVQIEHLRLDEGMLWHINQSVAVGVIAGNKYDSNRITYWDFISTFMGIFMSPATGNSFLFLSQSGTAKEYRIERKPSFNSITDNNVYSYVEGRIKGNNLGWHTKHLFDDDRNHYKGYDPFPTPSSEEFELNREEYFSGGEAGNNFSVYKSLVFMFHKHWAAGDQIIWGSTTDNGAYVDGHCITADEMIISKQNAKSDDWTVKNRRRVNALRVDDQKKCNLNVGTQSLITSHEVIV
ncbi:hypothetical protein LCGC14_1825100, partial [marine sediment metagenome]